MTAGDRHVQPAPASLVDRLDRVLATGVVLSADITLAIAEIDLVHVSLQALLASVNPTVEPP